MVGAARGAERARAHRASSRMLEQTPAHVRSAPHVARGHLSAMPLTTAAFGLNTPGTYCLRTTRPPNRSLQGKGSRC